MASKTKRLTQREKAARAAAKKRLQADGILPPDKPRLKRKRFAQETWEEWTALVAEDGLRAAMALCRAVGFTTGPELLEVTPEQVGILKAMKIAVEYEKFLHRQDVEGRSDYTLGELADEVIVPVWKL